MSQKKGRSMDLEDAVFTAPFERPGGENGECVEGSLMYYDGFHLDPDCELSRYIEDLRKAAVPLWDINTPFDEAYDGFVLFLGRKNNPPSAALKYYTALGMLSWRTVDLFLTGKRADGYSHYILVNDLLARVGGSDSVRG